MTKEEFWEHKKKLLPPDQRSYRSFELGVRYGEQQNAELKAQIEKTKCCANCDNFEIECRNCVDFDCWKLKE